MPPGPGPRPARRAGRPTAPSCCRCPPRAGPSASSRCTSTPAGRSARRTSTPPARSPAQAGRAVARVHRQSQQAEARRGAAAQPAHRSAGDPGDAQVVVRYVPAAEAARVGGDWYDAFLQRDGAPVLVIGDVVGHDTAAAAAMGQLRGAAARHRPPQRRRSGRGAARAGRGDGRACTPARWRPRPSPGSRAPARAGRAARLRWANAGHPPPVLLGADGTVTVLGGAGRRPHARRGLPTAERAESVVDLAPGDTVAALHRRPRSSGAAARSTTGLDRLRELPRRAGRTGRWRSSATRSSSGMLQGTPPGRRRDRRGPPGPARRTAERPKKRLASRLDRRPRWAPHCQIRRRRRTGGGHGVDWHGRCARCRTDAARCGAGIWARLAELPAARAALRSRLGDVGFPRDDEDAAGEQLILAFDELASNALRHGESPVVATVVAGSGGWLLDVSDRAPETMPTPGGRPRSRPRAAWGCTWWPGCRSRTAGTSTAAPSTCGPACPPTRRADRSRKRRALGPERAGAHERRPGGSPQNAGGAPRRGHGLARGAIRRSGVTAGRARSRPCRSRGPRWRGRSG